MKIYVVYIGYGYGTKLIQFFGTYEIIEPFAEVAVLVPKYYSRTDSDQRELG